MNTFTSQDFAELLSVLHRSAKDDKSVSSPQVDHLLTKLEEHIIKIEGACGHDDLMIYGKGDLSHMIGVLEYRKDNNDCRLHSIRHGLEQLGAKLATERMLKYDQME
jgi:hypothetical protein